MYGKGFGIRSEQPDGITEFVRQKALRDVLAEHKPPHCSEMLEGIGQAHGLQDFNPQYTDTHRDTLIYTHARTHTGTLHLNYTSV